MAVRPLKRGKDGVLRVTKADHTADDDIDHLIAEEQPDLGLLTIEQAAIALHVSVRTIRNWISAREIPYVKMGGRVLFDRTDLIDWIKSKKIAAKE